MPRVSELCTSEASPIPLIIETCAVAASLIDEDKSTSKAVNKLINSFLVFIIMTIPFKTFSYKTTILSCMSTH